VLVLAAVGLLVGADAEGSGAGEADGVDLTTGVRGADGALGRLLAASAEWACASVEPLTEAIIATVALDAADTAGSAVGGDRGTDADAAVAA
jgi:hypothetical protein